VITPVSIYQKPEEFLPILEIFKERKPRSILEIGTYAGGSLYHWLSNASPDSHIASVDPYHDPAVDNRHLYDDWCAPGVTQTAIQGYSQHKDTLEQLEQFAPFDWVFIDGCHEYIIVSQDWRNSLRLSSPTGIIVLDDIITHPLYRVFHQVSRLWKEIQMAEYITHEYIADPNQRWGGLGLVYLGD